MKKIIWCIAAWFGMAALSAAEVICPADFNDPAWQRNGGWKLSGKVASARQQPNTYPTLVRRLALAADTYYKISFEYRCTDFSSSDSRLVLFAGDRETVFACAKTDTLAVAYVRLEKPADLLKLQLQGPDAFGVEIKNFIAESLSESDLQKITVDFNADGGPAPSFWRKQNWPGPGELTVVGAEEHIEGGRALRVAPGADKGNFGVYSNLLPLQPGKKYKLSFWGRATQPTGIRLGLDGYLAGQAKHWHKLGAFQLTPEWQVYSMLFDSPDLKEYPYMAKGTAYFNLGITGGPPVELKLITLELLP